jgi:hypothetical protein
MATGAFRIRRVSDERQWSEGVKEPGSARVLARVTKCHTVPFSPPPAAQNLPR